MRKLLVLWCLAGCSFGSSKLLAHNAVMQADAAKDCGRILARMAEERPDLAEAYDLARVQFNCYDIIARSALAVKYYAYKIPDPPIRRTLPDQPSPEDDELFNELGGVAGDRSRRIGAWRNLWSTLQDIGGAISDFWTYVKYTLLAVAGLFVLGAIAAVWRKVSSVMGVLVKVVGKVFSKEEARKATDKTPVQKKYRSMKQRGEV